MAVSISHLSSPQHLVSVCQAACVVFTLCRAWRRGAGVGLGREMGLFSPQRPPVSDDETHRVTGLNVHNPVRSLSPRVFASHGHMVKKSVCWIQKYIPKWPKCDLTDPIPCVVFTRLRGESDVFYSEPPPSPAQRRIWFGTCWSFLFLHQPTWLCWQSVLYIEFTSTLHNVVSKLWSW